MHPLHHLRLNCLLVPILLGATAAGGTIAIHYLAQERLADAWKDDFTHSIATWARLRGQGLPLSATLWRSVDSRWLATAELRLQDDRLLVVATSGEPTLGIHPPAALPAAVSAPQCWTLPSGRWAVAATVQPYTDAKPLFVYAEAPPPPTHALGLLATLIVIACLSLGLGWYLIRHLWRPVENLQRHADAALRGETPPADTEASEETAAVRSSVILLADRYRNAHNAPSSPPQAP